MGFIAKLFGGPLQQKATGLCRQMATEHERLMLEHIRQFADPVFWNHQLPPPRNRPAHPDSLMWARLFGAASPLAALKIKDPDSFRKVFGIAIKECEKGTSGGTIAKLEKEDVGQVLSQLVDRFQTL